MATTVITPSLPYSIADSFTEAVKTELYNYYYFIGGTPSLSSGESIQSESYKRKIRDNIIFMKRISPSDISLVTNLYRWSSGLVVDQWDDLLDMSDKKFYCVNVKNEVFKCLDNSNNSVSIIMPERPISDWMIPFKTSDGYTWQYLYTVDPFERNRFMTSRYLPVKSALSKYFYSGNSVASVNVIKAGSGYPVSQKTKLNIIPKHKSVYIKEVSLTGEILEFNEGDLNLISHIKYESGLNVSINTYTGVGASISINHDPETQNITGLTINNGGSNYRKGDSITLLKMPVIMASLDSNGSFHEVKIISQGDNDGRGGGFTEIPDIVIDYTSDDASSTSGKGLYYVNGERNPSALFEPIIDSNSESETYGKLLDIIIRDPGIDYDSTRATTIKVSGDGYGADFIPIVIGGKVVAVSVINPGRNYTWMNLDVLGGNTTNTATLEPIFIKSDIYSNQSILEQLITDPTYQGGIYSIKINNGGTKYNKSSTRITLSGDGTGATAIVDSVDSNGSITKIKMTSFGSGYTYCNISITDTERDTSLNPINASLRAIISPISGHGLNSADELFANQMIIHTQIQDETQLNYLMNEYTQFGIIRGVKDINVNDLSSVVSDFTSFRMIFNTINGLSVGSILTFSQSGRVTRYKVVKIELPNIVTLVQMSSIYRSLGNTGTFYMGSTAFRWTSILSRPSINKYSGELLYSGSIDSFTVDDQKRVSIKTKITI